MVNIEIVILSIALLFLTYITFITHRPRPYECDSLSKINVSSGKGVFFVDKMLWCIFNIVLVILYLMVIKMVTDKTSLYLIVFPAPVKIILHQQRQTKETY